ncbi:hypothetical protein NMY22_g12126 [Coprinellus aureogranulatus]|nr:hypothetical protein NMY22_g12126 [Coprinellus aureogranulatus]
MAIATPSCMKLSASYAHVQCFTSTLLSTGIPPRSFLPIRTILSLLLVTAHRIPRESSITLIEWSAVLLSRLYCEDSKPALDPLKLSSRRKADLYPSISVESLPGPAMPITQTDKPVIRHNIVLFGETGGGKSPIINMLMGSDVAATSSSGDGCTLKSTAYRGTIGDQVYTFWDTAGLDEADIGKVPDMKAVANLYHLLRKLEGGVSLLVFCMRKPKNAWMAARQNWELFKHVICQDKVPALWCYLPIVRQFYGLILQFGSALIELASWVLTGLSSVPASAGTWKGIGKLDRRPSEVGTASEASEGLRAILSPWTTTITMTSSYFAGAHHFRVDNLSISNPDGHSETAIQCLQHHIAVGAIHNSDERCDAPTCYPETRVAVQEDILSWITHGHQDAQPMQIMWLSGPAGSGKTAIAASVAEACQERGLLAASFFFSSFSPSPERSSKRCLVPTLAYQLLQHEGLEGMERYVLKAIQRDPAIFRKRMRDQFEALILRPLRGLWSQSAGRPADVPNVFIIDGVDEVQAEQMSYPSQLVAPRADSDDHFEIISSLLHAAKDPAFHFRIIVVTRPERVFTEFFSGRAENYCKHLFLDEKYDPDLDIRLYTRLNIAKLQRLYRLSPSWPSEASLSELVRKASGQFIFATTVIRYISDGRRPPPAQLDDLLSASREENRSNPFGALDALYTHILKSSPSLRLAAQWILAIVTNPQLPAGASRLILETEEGEAEHLLRPLASLIHIPGPTEELEMPYRVYHKSIQDFLTDRIRCPESLFVCVMDNEELPGRQMFLLEPWLALLINKGPRVPRTPSENEDFLNVLTSPSKCGCDMPSVWAGKAGTASAYVSETEAYSCDWYWWTTSLLDSKARPLSKHYALMNALFGIHEKMQELGGRHRKSLLRVWMESTEDSPEYLCWNLRSRTAENRVLKQFSLLHQAIKAPPP